MTPEMYIGAGLGIIGIGFPVGIAILKFKRPNGVMTEKLCDSKRETFDAKLDAVNDRLDIIVELIKDGRE